MQGGGGAEHLRGGVGVGLAVKAALEPSVKGVSGEPRGCAQAEGTELAGP